MSAIIKQMIGDALLTCLYVASVSTYDFFMSPTAEVLQDHVLAKRIFATLLLAVIFYYFEVLSDHLGGAQYNPTSGVPSYVAGLNRPGNLSSSFSRPVAQAAGAVIGVSALQKCAPKYTLMLATDMKVDILTGAFVEGGLTFVISLGVLWMAVRWPEKRFVQSCLIAVFCTAISIAGNNYAEAFFNPASAYGWAYIDNSHNTWEHFYVYWLGPYTGAVLAGLVFRLLRPPREVQE